MTTSNSGTYKFDPKTRKVIRVSDKIPSCAKKTKGGSCGCGGCCCHGH